MTASRSTVRATRRTHRRGQALRWAAPRAAVVGIVVLVLSASAVVVSGANRGGVARYLDATSDMYVPGDEITTDPAHRTPAAGEARRTSAGMRFGPESGPETLVLFDPDSEWGTSNEFAALNAAMMATHFGPVTAQAVDDYIPGQLRDADAVLYIGGTGDTVVPAALAEDVLAGHTPIMWAGANLEQVAATAPQQFRETYGWDPTTAQPAQQPRPDGVRYKGQVVGRDIDNNPAGIIVPDITDASAVTVLADAVCDGKPCGPNGSERPWAIRSANLTYIGEVPFAYTAENDRHLVYADLMYDLVGVDPEPTRQAAVRLEDVSPVSDPDTIRAYADYLGGEGIPFQIALIPRYMDPHGVDNEGRATSVTLAQAPRVAEALRYAQSKGAVIVQHGTTHQLNGLDNPYSGVTGDDYEFFRAVCSDVSPTQKVTPADYTTCDIDSPVRLVGPPDRDTIAGATARIQHGIDLMEEAGLGRPTIFEPPHYAASSNAYRAMRELYDTRYGRDEYADGLLTGRDSEGYTMGVRVPYRHVDPFGSAILPENVGNFALAPYSGHPPKDEATLIANAKANLVVRESTASFFFHPFLPIEHLKTIVDGIRDLGYTFVPAEELK
ncbi:MAG: DUF2334 domain-containing protein [Mobilicoccus sp.]|nr:DUF2334 domain-containing protein [Mobilicoccus sp.]